MKQTFFSYSVLITPNLVYSCPLQLLVFHSQIAHYSHLNLFDNNTRLKTCQIHEIYRAGVSA